MAYRFLLAYSILLMLTACQRTEPIYITAEHWATGDTTWFEINHIDSVFSNDSSQLRRSSYKAVRLVVLSVDPQPRLEWQEFMLDSIVDPMGIQASDTYWYPAMRIEYSCNLEGNVQDLLNFSELHTYMDTMTQRYLDLVPSITNEQRELVRGVFLDSTWILARSMSDVDLFHRCYGYDIASGTDHGRLIKQDLGLGPVDFTTSLSNTSICDEPGVIGISGTMKTDSASIGSLMGSIQGLSSFVDSLGVSYMAADIRFTVCFDKSYSLPSYVNQSMDAELFGNHVQKTTTIYINRNWNVPFQ